MEDQKLDAEQISSLGRIHATNASTLALHISIGCRQDMRAPLVHQLQFHIFRNQAEIEISDLWVSGSMQTRQLTQAQPCFSCALSTSAGPSRPPANAWHPDLPTRPRPRPRPPASAAPLPLPIRTRRTAWCLEITELTVPPLRNIFLNLLHPQRDIAWASQRHRKLTGLWLTQNSLRKC